MKTVKDCLYQNRDVFAYFRVLLQIPHGPGIDYVAERKSQVQPVIARLTSEFPIKKPDDSFYGASIDPYIMDRDARRDYSSIMRFSPGPLIKPEWFADRIDMLAVYMQLMNGLLEKGARSALEYHSMFSRQSMDLSPADSLMKDVGLERFSADLSYRERLTNGYDAFMSGKLSYPDLMKIFLP